LILDGTEPDNQLLKRMAYVFFLKFIHFIAQHLFFSVKYEEPCWSLTQPNQSTTSTYISTSSNDDPMVNCISQPIKLDDLILITEPRSLTEMGDVSHQTNETKPISFGFFLYFSARSI